MHSVRFISTTSSLINYCRRYGIIVQYSSLTSYSNTYHIQWFWVGKYDIFYDRADLVALYACFSAYCFGFVVA